MSNPETKRDVTVVVGSGGIGLAIVRIPGQGGHRFRGKTDTDSTRRRPPFPREGGR